MAATGYTPIQLYYSTTASATPAAGNLLSGELAINITDGKLYYKDNAGAVQLLSTSTTANGTANGVLYLNGSKVATSGSALTFDGSSLVGTGKFQSQVLRIKDANYSEIYFSTADTGGNGAISYNQSLNAMAFYANGSEQMRLTSTGLGIGTSSPAVKLQVYNNINGTPFAWGNATRTGYLYQDQNGVGITNASGTSFDEGVYLDTANSKVILYTNSTDRVTIDSSGNLGLGVTPSAWWTGGSTKAFDVSTLGALWSGAGISVGMLGNAFFSSSLDFRYKTTAAASRYDQEAGAHKWYTAASGTAGDAISFTQAMTLDSSGNLLVGTTSSLSNSGTGFKVTNPVAGHWDAFVTTSQNNTSYSCWDIYSTATSSYRFYVTTTGVVNAVSTTITAISDQRLKENIRDLDDGLDVVMALKPRKFDWKEGKGKNIKGDRGWIAQEFETVLPDMIEEWRDPAPEGEEPYKAINANLIPTLVKAIQELKAEFDAYKASHP